MLDLEDDRWDVLTGGYGGPYDPRDALEDLEANEDTKSAWAELWEELHHQGDVGTASYAAVCVIADLLARGVLSDWNGYALAVTIEMQRSENGNPELPDWIAAAYESAWACLAESALKAMPEASDPTLIGQLLGVLAMWKGQRSLSRMASDFDEDGRAEIFEAANNAWDAAAEAHNARVIAPLG